jgi:hypothetical protein
MKPVFPVNHYEDQDNDGDNAQRKEFGWAEPQVFQIYEILWRDA